MRDYDAYVLFNIKRYSHWYDSLRGIECDVWQVQEDYSGNVSVGYIVCSEVYIHWLIIYKQKNIPQSARSAEYFFVCIANCYLP
jgi:hypothetical protein